MITDEQLEDLAKNTETDRVERKESWSSKQNEIAEAICAYANDLPEHRQPGYLLIGVDDGGEPSGLQVTDQLLQTLAAIRSDGNILPLPNLSVEKRQLGGVDIAVVVVHPSGDPPVRYRGRVCVRVGPRKGVASRDEERILHERRQSGDLPFDRRGCPGATIEDLDLGLFRQSYLPAAVAPEVLEENERSLEHQLGALHLLGRDGRPTYGAILLVGKDPRQWLPCAYVQFARFDGSALSNPILDQKEISGSVGQVIRTLEDLARINIRVATEIGEQVTERRAPDYPLSALQQLLRNALLHRTYEANAPVHWYWYSDRIEIQSPGGLYGRVTPETFGRADMTDYRNPSLAEGLKVLGFVQRFGIGIQLARKGCTENANPPPEFEFGPSAVLATILRQQ
jgi:ATP-dependent DNA helicase RecG